MSGPAAVLVELFEGGLETPDLLAVKRLQKIYAHPKENLFVEDEAEWECTLPASRLGLITLTAPSGHYLMVHLRWLKARVIAMQAAAIRNGMSEEEVVYLKAIADRYAGFASQLEALPRSTRAKAPVEKAMDTE